MKESMQYYFPELNGQRLPDSRIHATVQASWDLITDEHLTPLLANLTQIRKEAMKIYMIKGAFQGSRKWSLPLKTGLKKIRSYGRKKRTLEESLDEETQPDLPLLPPNRPSDLWNTVNIQSFNGRDLTQFSDNAKEISKKKMVVTAVNLHKAHLTTVEHATLQEKVKRETTRKKASRRSIHKGGAAANIGVIRERMKIRDETERIKSLRKAKKALQIAINKSAQALRVAGVAARKENKEKKRVAACIARSDISAPTDLLLLREPDKNLTILEAASMTPEGHHEYLHVVLQAEKESNGELEGKLIGFPELKAGELFIRLGNNYQREDVEVKYIESSPIWETFVESSDVESDAGSIDSISLNADFIAFNNI
ncbi:hypothetical protein GcM1_157002 [Golovinomyces cichoracearum]|uniref:Uncharacterized protein n=1 Tax=Golovinomyces cichoracearum TaxID=62708 RepID=A0A420J9Y4_9PEZI|nr:hypothetical protein GcM1_157002 [Golovinomyces cichoracearum]